MTNRMLTEIPVVYNQLYQTYGCQHWWPAETAFEVMVGAILVQNTAWKNVEKAMLQLEPYLDPVQMFHLPIEKLEQLIRSSGFFRIKARRLHAFLTWFKNYDFKMEQLHCQDTYLLRNQLLAINGIGPETADSILLYALHRPVFVIDAYTRRIFKRLGFDLPKKYQDLRYLFEAALVKDVQLYNEYHALIVQHAKVHCKVKPICPTCPLLDRCEQNVGS
ncbi:endonuclease III domain-containing protein [Amphibacillus cookii]|uniref:endonuclease III domain-containing protein n=1 Tax=Amphibacillus cookii TaxID=767787 RepID=UPI00195AC2FE|nr:endonuclease III domain-containing protein [Amphibacillus cookii]MBM7542648.1 endonuclease-3 related protein [Amphibacillus cookii]